jgi:hypothetical protein
MADSIPRSDYHSAHTMPLINYEPREEFRIGASIAFRHDLTEGLTPHFQFCDAVYADLPWANGFDEFNRRAGVEDGRTYREFMTSVAEAVDSLERPTVLVTGRHALKMLPKPDAVHTLQLNQYQSVALLYRCDPKPFWATATDLLVDWAVEFDSIGDFCCGYGRALKVFHRRGKPFVGSDFNPYCIGYIAAHAEEWV